MEHDFCQATLQDEYDRVFITFYTFNYLINGKACDNFVRNVYRVLSTGGIIVADLFYPTTLANPEKEGEWIIKIFTMNGQKIILRDKREMTGDTEKRIQQYVNGSTVDEIVTERRFFDKSYIEKRLADAGFKNIRFADGYTANNFHRLKRDEKVTGNYLVLAEK